MNLAHSWYDFLDWRSQAAAYTGQHERSHDWVTTFRALELHSHCERHYSFKDQL
jgi:hypothetical protein